MLHLYSALLFCLNVVYCKESFRSASKLEKLEITEIIDVYVKGTAVLVGHRCDIFNVDILFFKTCMNFRFTILVPFWL